MGYLAVAQPDQTFDIAPDDVLGGDVSGLGFSFKLPHWVPSIIRTPINKIITGAQVKTPPVTVNLPGGGSSTIPGQVFTTSPSGTVTSHPMTPIEAAGAAANSADAWIKTHVPGGWFGVLAGVGAVVMVPKLLRPRPRRRRRR